MGGACTQDGADGMTALSAPVRVDQSADIWAWPLWCGVPEYVLDASAADMAPKEGCKPARVWRACWRFSSNQSVGGVQDSEHQVSLLPVLSLGRGHRSGLA